MSSEAKEYIVPLDCVPDFDSSLVQFVALNFKNYKNFDKILNYEFVDIKGKTYCRFYPLHDEENLWESFILPKLRKIFKVK